MPLLPCGTEMEDARGMQSELAEMEAREAHARAIVDDIAHDEQLQVWADEMVSRPDISGFLVEAESYDDGLACHAAFKAAVRDLAESVVERVLAHQERLARTIRNP